MTKRVLGIDLGTTNSAAALMEDGEPLIIPIDGNKFTLSSVVAFMADGNHRVGAAAKRESSNDATNTVFAAKRLIGRSFQDPDTLRAIQAVPYTCVEGSNGDVRIKSRSKTYTIQEISALVLAEIKRCAEHHLGQKIEKAVVTVPAYFNDRQRHATKDAGTIAGLEVIAVVNEPTAAALAYGLQQGADRKIAVFDLGGGTFDVSVLKVGGGLVEVMASAGDAFLGGHDFDKRLFDWLVERIETGHGVNIFKDANAAQRLRESAEIAKIQLTDKEVTRIALPFLTTDRNDVPINFECELERSTFETLVEDLVSRTITTFLSTLEEAGVESKDVDEVLMVGGMTNMPGIRRRVLEVVGCEPSTGVHPDLVVAVGAAVQGMLLADERSEAVLVDVTPHGLGIRTVAGFTDIIIPNTRLPTSAKRRFTTVKDGQDLVKVVVCQGDSRKINENQVLGDFQLTGLRSAPRGEVEIDVSFDISADGIVAVSAIDIESGKAGEIRIKNPLGLDDEELRRMVAANADRKAQTETGT